MNLEGLDDGSRSFMELIVYGVKMKVCSGSFKIMGYGDHECCVNGIFEHAKVLLMIPIKGP